MASKCHSCLSVFPVYLRMSLIPICISSGVIGPPPFPPATSSMTSYSGSPGLQGYHQSPVPQFGTSQSESMQVTGPSSEVQLYK